MKKSSIFDFNVDQVSKLNKLLPKGYKIITLQENVKRLSQWKKKPKVQYVPLAQLPPLISQNSQSGPPGRRVKAPVSYYQDVNDVPQKNKSYQEYEPQKQKIKRQQTFKRQNLQVLFPPVFPSRVPLSAKEILQQIEKHPKFSVISQFKRDLPNKNNYDAIVVKARNENYSLHELLQNMSQLFINIYGFYPRTSNIYNDAAELQGYLNALINAEKGKLKQQKIQKIKEVIIREQIQPSIPQLVRQPSNIQQQLVRKKTATVAKPDIKNISIMDKRILGQNIKKLPNQCLGDICRIAFQTIQTREQYIIDIDTLPLKKVRELQTYVNNCMSTRFGEIQFGNQIRNQGDSSESSFVIQDDFD